MSTITPTILLFYGEDTYRSGQKLAALKTRYIDASLGDTNLAVLDGATISFEDFVRQVQALPFLAKSRLVIVKNIFAGGKKDLLDAVAGYLTKVPTTTVVVFYEAGVPDKRLKLFTLLNQKKAVEVFPFLIGTQLTAWITHRARELDLELVPWLVSWLVTAVGSDLARLNQELIKLSSYQLTKKEPISEDDLAALVWQTVPSDAFRLVDALSNRRGAQAVRELAALLKAGQAELQIFGLIVFQYRTLLLVSEAWQGGQRNAAALAKLLRIHPFVAQKLLPLASREPLMVWEERYQRLLDYDVLMKTGRLEPKLALKLLIGEFCGEISRPSMNHI